MSRCSMTLLQVRTISLFSFLVVTMSLLSPFKEICPVSPPFYPPLWMVSSPSLIDVMFPLNSPYVFIDLLPFCSLLKVERREKQSRRKFYGKRQHRWVRARILAFFHSVIQSQEFENFLLHAMENVYICIEWMRIREFDGSGGRIELYCALIHSVLAMSPVVLQSL